MSQRELNLIARIDGPSVARTVDIAKIHSYAEAVLYCYVNRRIKGITNEKIAAETGMRASHIPDYLSFNRFDSKGRERREMPAKYVDKFEDLMGNTIITQWQIHQKQMRILEVMLAEAA